MTEETGTESHLSEASFHFLRRQVLLLQGYALSLAHELGITPEEAGRRFWHGLAGDRPPRAVTHDELERIVEVVAEDTRLIYGSAVTERAGMGWRVIAIVSEPDRRALERWGVPVEYAIRWLAEVQRHEGAQILTDWATRLDGDRIIQELTPGA